MSGAQWRHLRRARHSSSAPGRIRTSDQQLRRLLLYPPELRARDCAATTYGALLHRVCKECQKQCQNLMPPHPATQGGELLLEHLAVLGDAVLNDLGAMPHRAEMAVDALHQGL